MRVIISKFRCHHKEKVMDFRVVLDLTIYIFTVTIMKVEK